MPEHRRSATRAELAAMLYARVPGDTDVDSVLDALDAVGARVEGPTITVDLPESSEPEGK